MQSIALQFMGYHESRGALEIRARQGEARERTKAYVTERQHCQSPTKAHGALEIRAVLGERGKLEGAYLAVSDQELPQLNDEMRSIYNATFYFVFITAFPPIYGLNASGMVTLPSACKWFSMNAINIRGGATTVLLRVWASLVFPSVSL